MTEALLAYSPAMRVSLATYDVIRLVRLNEAKGIARCLV